MPTIMPNNQNANQSQNKHYDYKDGRGPPPKMKTAFGRYLLRHPLQAQIMFSSFVPIMMYIVACFFEFSFWTWRPYLGWFFDFEILRTTPPFKWVYIYYTTLFQWIYDFDFSLYYCVIIFYLFLCVFYALRTLNNSTKKLDVNHNVINYPISKKVDHQTKNMIMDIKEEWQTNNKGGVQSTKLKSKKALLKGQKKERLKAQMKKGSLLPGQSWDEVEPGPSSSMCEYLGTLPDCACEACLNEVD